MSLVPATTPCPPDTIITQFDTCGTVNIHHPKLPEILPFLSFDAFSSKSDGDVLGGVPLGVVLDACYVVAGNKKGQLHLSAQPQERVAGDDSDLDGLLVPGEYQFVVIQEGGGLDYSYDLCASFAAWTPPASIPARWQGGNANYVPCLPSMTDVSAAVIFEDKACIVTGATTGLQASHLVPESEANWVGLHYEILKIYGRDLVEELNSLRNEVTLRADLDGQGLDQALFFLVPYADSMITLFVSNMAPDLASRYHFRQTRFPTRIRRGYLFVRFAWNIFKLWGPRLEQTVKWMASGGGGFKRKRGDDTDGPSKKGRKHARGSEPGGGSTGDGRLSGSGKSGGGGEQKDVESADDSEDAGSLDTDDEAQLALYELMDAEVTKKPCLSVDDVEAGRYPGFSKIKRLELQYRRAHPEISAVGGSRV